MATTFRTDHPPMAKAAATVVAALSCYTIFLGTLLAFIAFLGGFLPVPLVLDLKGGWPSLAVDAGLVLLFGLQHSIMARPWFKHWWIRLVPEPLERSVYVLCASLALLALVVFWQPLPGTAWSVQSPISAALIWSAFALGWVIVLVTTFMIDHFELFGLRQAWAYATGRGVQDVEFKTPSAYRLVRHPMQLGFVIALWASPDMTTGRLAAAALLTLYILVALKFEERDLVGLFGDQYRDYQRTVPRLLPRLWRS